MEPSEGREHKEQFIKSSDNGDSMISKEPEVLEIDESIYESYSQEVAKSICVHCGHPRQALENVCESCGARLPKMVGQKTSAENLLTSEKTPAQLKLEQQLADWRNGKLDAGHLMGLIEIRLNNAIMGRETVLELLQVAEYGDSCREESEFSDEGTLLLIQGLEHVLDGVGAVFESSVRLSEQSLEELRAELVDSGEYGSEAEVDSEVQLIKEELLSFLEEGQGLIDDGLNLFENGMAFMKKAYQKNTDFRKENIEGRSMEL